MSYIFEGKKFKLSNGSFLVLIEEVVDENGNFAAVLAPAEDRFPDIGIGMDGCCGRKGDADTVDGYTPLIGVVPTPIYALLTALSNVCFIAGLIVGRLGRGGGIADL